MTSAMTVIGVKTQNLMKFLLLLKYFYHYLNADLQATSAYSLHFIQST